MKHTLIGILMVVLLAGGARPDPQKRTPRSSALEPADLRSEYLVDPLGVDRPKPRLSWVLEDKGHERGQKQLAYQILVATSEKALKADTGDLWDTGKRESAETNQITYSGRDLVSRMRCYWKVRVWDVHGTASAWSRTATWTIGLLANSDWKAQWIGADSVALTGEAEKDSVARLMTPSPLLRKTFTLISKASRATVYATALGLYELRLNGKKIGDHILAPEWTDYTRRIQYQTYDVSGMLRKGENIITAMLADGWYIGAMGTWGDPRICRGKNYGSVDRKLLMQMEIETADSGMIHVVTDESWRIKSDGPILSADIYLGETFDSRKVPAGWERPGFNDSYWKKATVYPPPGCQIVAQMNQPVRAIAELKPVAVTEPVPGKFIFDMGQNMVGWCVMKLGLRWGQQVTLRYGEVLEPRGTLYTANLRRADQTDRFIANGKGVQVYEPRFTYHGFRYVEISGLAERPSLGVLTGREISSDVRSTGNFECSNPDLNRLWKNILWTQRDNLIGVPTDCPQRDERLGWMADAQIFSQTAIYNCDMSAFFTKWCQDIRDSQGKDGQYPDVAPEPPALNFYNAPAWADAGVIIPWRMYQNYGDITVLKEHYESAKRFIDFVQRMNPQLHRTDTLGNQYGDWLNCDSLNSRDYPLHHAELAHPIFNTIYFAVSSRILSEMATVLGRAEDAEHYARLSQAITDTLRRAYVGRDGSVSGGTQAGYALMMGFDLLPDELRPEAFDRLIGCLKEYRYRISTGFLSTVKLMDELVRGGRTDLAYRLLESHRFPSWLYQIDQGATTVWERWDGYVKGRGFQDPGMNSFNHYAIGSIGEWMYRHILGIQADPQHPGFRGFSIHPQIGKTLSWAKGSYRSINGMIASEWRVKAGSLTLHVEIPPNTNAYIYVPARDRKTVREGRGPAESAKGVKYVWTLSGAAVYEVLPGSYTFTADIGRR